MNTNILILIWINIDSSSSSNNVVYMKILIRLSLPLVQIHIITLLFTLSESPTIIFTCFSCLFPTLPSSFPFSYLSSFPLFIYIGSIGIWSLSSSNASKKQHRPGAGRHWVIKGFHRFRPAFLFVFVTHHLIAPTLCTAKCLFSSAKPNTPFSVLDSSTISLCHKKIEKITPRNRNIYLLHAHCKYPVNK